MDLKLSGRYFMSMAMKYSAIYKGPWPEHLPREERLRDVGFFYSGKEMLWGSLMATCQHLPEETELGSFWRCAATRREAVVLKCSWEIQT